MIPKNEVVAKADKAFPDIVKAAISWKPTKDQAVKQQAPYPAARMKFKGTYADVNQMFSTRKWSLSLPIVPPTPDKVAAMLKGTQRKPSEVLWVVPPRQGMLTVELVAVLGVMAGAKPEHMPLLIATVEAFKDPGANFRGATTTTAATYPLVIISGPVVEQLGLNYGTGTAGGENPVTNALGYFVNLMGDVVGGSVPPNMDKSTHGSSADLVATVFTENAAANPWGQSFGEYQGFKKTDSVVTVVECYPPSANIDHDATTGPGLLNTFATGILGVASGIASCESEFGGNASTNYNYCSFVMLMVSPEHATTMHQDFKTLRGVQEYLVKECVMPFKRYTPANCKVNAQNKPGLTPDTLVARFTKPESIHVVVTGGAGKQSQIWTPFVQVAKPVSVKIGN